MIMKSIKNKLRIASLSLVIMLLGSSTVLATEYTKTSSKSFDVKSGALLDLNTEFGDIKAYNWDKQKISIEATITVSASSQSKADERFRRIQLEINGDKNIVSVLSKIESGFFNKNGNNISIDFIIYYPSDIRLKMNLDFGSAFFEDIKGATDIEVSYGSFNANNLSSVNNEIQISFGKLQVATVEAGNIEIEYGGCEIEESKTLDLRTSFSGNVNIEKVGKLLLKSAYDKVSIGEANEISGGVEFTSFTLQRINTSLDMKAAYGGFKVYSINPNFKLIDLRSEFCGLKLYVDANSNFTFYADVELGSFDYPKEKVTITNFQKDVTELMMEGYFGTKEKAKGNMRLSVEHASATINLK